MVELGSHVQTRTLADALRAADEILTFRGTRLAPCAARDQLDRLFAEEPCEKFFRGWAFDALEFDKTVAKVTEIAPQLAERLKPPQYREDFTIVGHCAMRLLFDVTENGAKSAAILLGDGRRLDGAWVKSYETRLYANGLIGIPAVTGETVYIYHPTLETPLSAAELAYRAFAARGEVTTVGAIVCFPKGRTRGLADVSWVRGLKSACGYYRVMNFVNVGKSFIDENGYFARETVVAHMTVFSESPAPMKVIIDGPFLAFFADDTGVHAATWFSWDSFSPAPAGLRDAHEPEPTWSEDDIDELFND